MTATADQVEELSRDRTLTERILDQREFGVVLAVLALAIIGTIVRADVFITLGNFLSVIRSAAIVTIMGYGMSMLITSGEFDLSVGSLMGLGGALMAVMRIKGFGVPFIIVSVLLFAVVYGAVQGLLVTKLGLPSLIVTIGTLTLVHGAQLIVLGNVTQAIPDQKSTLLLKAIGGTMNLDGGYDILIPFTDIKIFTLTTLKYSIPIIHNEVKEFSIIPIQLFWVALLGVAFHYLLFYTRFGYHTRATGGDVESARLAGIDTDKIKMANFSIVAAVSVFAGMSQVAFTSNASATTGQGLELIVIASVVIGGTDLFGGDGTMVGTLLGALVFALIQNILVLAGMGTQLFSVLTGAFIIFAIGLDAATRHIEPGTFREKLVVPLAWIRKDPRGLFRHVREEGQGITPSVTFAALILSIWSLVQVLVVIPTFFGANLFGGPILPLQFKIGFLTSGVGAIGLLPVAVFTVGGMIYFLTAVFVHAGAKPLDGEEPFDTAVKIVGYAMAPFIIAVVPFSLLGFNFLTPLIVLAWLLVVAPMVALLYFGITELYGLDRGEALGVIAATVILWLVTIWVTSWQMSAFAKI